MTKREKEQEARAALAFANEIRRVQGLKPLLKLPKGTRSSPYSCPLGRATEATVTPYSCDVDINIAGTEITVAVNLPEKVRSFVRNFDNKQFPELEA